MPYSYNGGAEEHPYNYEDFSTPTYLTGYASKIIHDLEKVARLYNGKKVALYRSSGEDRCPDCTDSITGQKVFSGCKTCNGSGTLLGYTKLSEQWCYLDLTSEYNVESETGSTDNPGGVRQQLIFIGPPQLRHGDLFVTQDTKNIFKIIVVEPQLVAMAGSIVSQMTQVSKLTPGQIENELIKPYV